MFFKVLKILGDMAWDSSEVDLPVEWLDSGTAQKKALPFPRQGRRLQGDFLPHTPRLGESCLFLDPFI